MVSRFSSWQPRQPSWIVKRNNLSNSESLCHSNASHQVSAQSNFRLGRRCRLKIGHLGDWNGTIIAILKLCRSDASHKVLAHSDLQFGRCYLKNFKKAAMAAILDSRTEQF